MMPQLELFDVEPAPGALCGPETAPAAPGGTSPPPRRRGAADGALSADSAAVPARCPVLGRAVCYRQDCRHWSADRCAHPERDKRTPQRRRR